jgi:hypothetical protein
MHKNMFTSCVEPVHSLRLTPKVAHNLCADHSTPTTHPGHNPQHLPAPTAQPSQSFPPTHIAHLSLLFSHLSTLYTPPITTTTTYI